MLAVLACLGSINEKIDPPPKKFLGKMFVLALGRNKINLSYKISTIGNRVSGSRNDVGQHPWSGPCFSG